MFSTTTVDLLRLSNELTCAVMFSKESVLSLISKGSVTDEASDGSLCSGLLITSTVLSVS